MTLKLHLSVLIWSLPVFTVIGCDDDDGIVDIDSPMGGVNGAGGLPVICPPAGISIKQADIFSFDTVVPNVSYSFEGHPMKVANDDTYDGAAIAERFANAPENDLKNNFSPVGMPICPWFDPNSNNPDCSIGAIPASSNGSIPFIVGAPLVIGASSYGLGQELEAIQGVFWDGVAIGVAQDLLSRLEQDFGIPIPQCRTGCIQTYRCLDSGEVLGRYYRAFDYYQDGGITKVRVHTERLDGTNSRTVEGIF